MRRLIVLVALAISGFAAAGVAASTALAGDLCVGSRPGCFSTIQAAVDAAKDGDTIHIDHGTFAGGITIDVSVELVGAGARSTVISGGGPVLTIGLLNAATEPTVSIEGVTITGGVNTSSPFPFVARGGGIDIPRAANFAPGATVTITNSIITGNRAEPAEATDSGIPCSADVTVTCINGDLPFAAGRGAGIATTGALTLTNCTVSRNVAGFGAASDAEGAGIFALPGSSVTLKNSSVTDNDATALAPNGRFADAGGVFVRGTLTIDNSEIRDNTADLSTSMPSDVLSGTAAIGAGVHILDSGSATIRNATIDGNTVTETNAGGDAFAFGGGVDSDGPIVVLDSTISKNVVQATTSSASGNAFADSGGEEGDATATISNTRFTDNSVRSAASSGLALAAAGGFGIVSSDLSTVSGGLVTGNTVDAAAPSGFALVQGAGLQNGGLMQLRNVDASDNSGTATGPAGLAQGGGIWNDVVYLPTVQLTVQNSAVTHNSLSASAGITVQGGGLFTAFPVTLDHVKIEKNVPDQCFGC